MPGVAIVKTVEMIAEIPLFAGLPDKQLNELLGIAEERRFDRGQMIFAEGELANGFYVLRSGRVKIFKLSSEGKEQILHIFGPGEPFGEVPVFAGERFPAYAEILETSEAVFFPKQSFVKLVKSDPSLALNLLAILSKRLKYFTQLVESLSLKEVPQRLATYLLFFRGSEEENSVDLAIAKGQLASLLGTIPETLSRILNKMTAQGLIEVQGRQIKLIDRKALERLAMGEKLLV
ncbi:MAG: Fumarate and nitrate reduction regulatory protein [Syntrophorhabdus sp. PtaU1.Bin002]|nr:MAG: Fumarate and nitrate reduction regulatory protein [Syntrophorhabdus sp. PtaU1.Bin002]